jgi:hypothetical protein
MQRSCRPGIKPVLDLSYLLAKFHSRPAADENLVAENEARLGLKLPPDYVEFLEFANGGDGFIGDNSYAILWGVDELPQFNLDYEITRWAPGFLAFGSDGGGEAFGFDTREENWPVIQLPFIGMDWKEARPIADSFHGFLQRLSEMD